MSRLLIQEALRNGVSLETIAQKLHITAKRHWQYSNLVLFKYDQIESDFRKLIVRQCRGLILDQDRGWEVVSRPFDKFFNYGEGLAAPIDWATARVQEKLDGSLIQMYHYDGRWRVGTSGTPDASGTVNGHPYTFASLFWQTWGEQGLRLPADTMQGITFLFELMTPYNRIVVNHKDCQIRFIGARERRGDEHNVQLAFAHRRWPVVQHFPLSSMGDALSTFETMDPLVQEGYVIVDGHFNRVKVKHPGYVALHHAVSSMTQRSLVDVVRHGEQLEVLQAFPEWGQRFADIQDSYNWLVGAIEHTYDKVKDIQDQKEFALRVKDLPISGILFAKRKGTPIRVSLRNMHIDKLIPLLLLPPETPKPALETPVAQTLQE